MSTPPQPRTWFLDAKGSAENLRNGEIALQHFWFPLTPWFKEKGGSNEFPPKGHTHLTMRGSVMSCSDKSLRPGRLEYQADDVEAHVSKVCVELWVFEL